MDHQDATLANLVSEVNSVEDGLWARFAMMCPRHWGAHESSSITITYDDANERVDVDGHLEKERPNDCNAKPDLSRAVQLIAAIKQQSDRLGKLRGSDLAAAADAMVAAAVEFGEIAERRQINQARVTTGEVNGPKSGALKEQQHIDDLVGWFTDYKAAGESDNYAATQAAKDFHKHYPKVRSKPLDRKTVLSYVEKRGKQ